MKASVFLREKGLNHSFKIKGSEFNGTLLDLLNEYNTTSPVASGWFLFDNVHPEMGQIINIKWNDGTLDEYLEWAGLDFTESILPIAWEYHH